MKLEIYQVDAFANELFKGNPAMVVPLKDWLSDELMQNIAAENNLSETAFYVAEGDGFYIRWFTPTTEVKLCGHATLATAYVIYERGEVEGGLINFNCKSGLLKVEKNEEELTLDFPITTPFEIEFPQWTKHIGGNPISAHNCEDDYLLIYETEQEVLDLTPKLSELKNTKTRGIMCSSRSEEYDFVSRFFAPAAGIDEDPVTGSAHTKLVPYWAKVLGKKNLSAKQVSKRGGELNCVLEGERVKLSGKGKLYLKGYIFV